MTTTKNVTDVAKPDPKARVRDNTLHHTPLARVDGDPRQSQVSQPNDATRRSNEMELHLRYVVLRARVPEGR